MDFTREVKLNNKENKLYNLLRAGLFILFISGALCMAFVVLFPQRNAIFDFTSPNSTKNTLIDPRNESGNFLEKGLVSSNKNLFFDAVSIGIFSDANIKFKLNKKIPNEMAGKVNVRRAYRAFLYPEGEPLGYNEGFLIHNKENYYIISEGKLRQFSLASMDQLGFKKESFNDAAEADLTYNTIGENITSSSDYPESSIFIINDVFYILEKGQLIPFVNKAAYLSGHLERQAIQKNADFFQKYAIGNKQLGFSDGSLITYGDSVFIVSKQKIFPIDNPITFENNGFAWDDILPASGEEIALYNKEKLFNINKPHPDGVIFKDSNKPIWHMVKDGKKRPLFSENITRSWLFKKPVIVSSASLDIFENCALTRRILRFEPTYSCSVPLENLQKLSGFNYEFITSFTASADIKEANITFTRKINIPNLKSSIINLLNQIKNNYVAQP